MEGTTRNIATVHVESNDDVIAIIFDEFYIGICLPIRQLAKVNSSQIFHFIRYV